MERPNLVFNSSCEENCPPYPRYDECFFPNTTRSIHNKTNETKYAQKRQPIEHRYQSNPITHHESNSKINKIMQVIENYRIKEKKIQPKIEKENISSQNNSEQKDCEFKSNSEIQADQNPKQMEELNQEPTQTEPNVTSIPIRTEQGHSNPIPEPKTPEIYPPYVQEMIDEPRTCKPRNQSRLSDPSNGAMGDPPVNSCDFHDSRTNVPPDKSANHVQTLILSEPSTSVLCEVQKSSVATAIDTWSYLGPATLEISSELSESSSDMHMSPDKSPVTSDLPKAGIG